MSLSRNDVEPLIAIPSDPPSGVRLVARDYVPCLVVTSNGRTLARAPVERATYLMNRLDGATRVIREFDGALLATRCPVEGGCVLAWYVRMGWSNP